MDSIIKLLNSAKEHYEILLWAFGLLAGVIGGFYKLSQWFQDKVKLKITAALAIEHTDDIHGMIMVEVVNVGMRTAKVKKVSALLENSKLSNSDFNSPMSESAELNLPQKDHPVELAQDGGSHIWKGIVNRDPHFLAHVKGGEKYGQGFIMFTSGRKIRFEFILIPDSGWTAIENSQKSKSILAVGPVVYADYKKAFDVFESAETKLELYPRRLNVLQAAKGFLDDAISNRTVSHQSLQNFDRETNEAKNIFQKDIQDLLKNIRDGGSNLFYIAQKLSAPDYDNDRQKLAEKRLQILNSFIDLHKELDARFSRYLKITEES